MWGDFHVLNPLWLLALVPLAGLLWWVNRGLSHADAWRAVIDERLLQVLSLATQPDRPFATQLPWLLLGLAWLITVLALANPTFERRPVPTFSAGVARVVVLDLSQSMQVQDLSPSRLERARYKVADILARVKEGRVGLIAFAGDAFTVAPLTQDAQTIVAMLDALQPEIMPVPGSRPDLALERAGALLEQAGASQGEVILISDDAGDARAQNAAKALHAQGHRLAVIGVGTEQGAPVPGVRRADGPVMARLDSRALQALARAGGGSYATLTPDDQDLNATLSSDGAGRHVPAALTDNQAQAWYPLGPWLALVLLPVGALAFRRGWLLMTLPVVIGSGMSLMPAPALAFGWDDLWLRQDQQAAQALDQGDYEHARQLAHDPQRRGTAAYRAGDYQAAATDFAAGQTVTDQYNRGNALARAGALKEALAAYDQALALDSTHEDARYNRAQVEALLEQQQQNKEQHNEEAEQNAETSEPNQEQNDPSQTQDNQAGEQASSSAADPSEPATEDDREAAQPSEPEDAQPNKPDQSPMADAELADHSPQEREARAAAEQWLRRIPDDPGGLLRRKFLYQYSQRANPQRDLAAGEPW